MNLHYSRRDHEERSEKIILKVRKKKKEGMN
jgi:hypothetical protein